MDESENVNFKKFIEQIFTPLKEIPFSLVIKSLSGFKIIPFNKKNKKDETLLEKIIQAANSAGRELNLKGISRSRPNEVGGDIEVFVKKALISVGYNAETPKTKSGDKKATGYPDIEFVDEFGRVNYLECKTFNSENIKTTLRSFYVSPSNKFKITEEAHHFVLSFEMFVEKNNENNKLLYKCKSWKLLSIENLKVDVKYEFNSDNSRLYSKELIIAEESL